MAKVIEWFQVTAPHFCAGICVDRSRNQVSDAAPILRWAIGKPWAGFVLYAKRKSWTVRAVAPA